MIIQNQRFKQSILEALADHEMLAVLDSALPRPKSINEIMYECQIPHSSAYRKVGWMIANGLLVVDRILITDTGKKSSLVRSTLRSIQVRYEHGSVVVEAEKNIDAIEKTVERFFSLDADM